MFRLFIVIYYNHCAMANKKAVKRKKNAKQRKTTKRKWSATVTEHSDALDLKSKIFTNDDPAYIAKSLRKSALKSRRKKGTPYQSAMSMLNFYINRAGNNLSAHQKEILEKAKPELRELFGREEKKGIIL